ncbi:DUF1127 domain-containing protein [Hansschlegelia beijingensis]|uniref:Uncharacterized protein YjiS (DUF1127 family) n=1 Tax=Hansschlegelia beijingensis TaxID=1133344 RepID=A0A7W6GEI6_9HYPH|nr:DUF1127 domain-containing protein [Hansschlegelia beijingensis]MBB3972078.1 uncharacterized protein YjiS (DUF1127 family) [Hansschlegelia beijingensis]
MLFWTFLLKRYRTWRSYRATLEELASLDDRALADINVARSEIPRVARQAALASS